MVKLYNDFTYVADPHGAVGYLGLKKYQETHPETYGIFLETAHPVKFLDVVEDTIRENIDLPESIVKVMGKKKKAIKISQYDELKGYLLKK
jgi:threonine synthase